MVNLFVPNQNYSTASNNFKSSIQLKSNSSNNETNLICATVSHKFQTSPELMISRLSFSHLREIMAFDDPLARYFYEQECIKCTWSVRELRRQISTNLNDNPLVQHCQTRGFAIYYQLSTTSSERLQELAVFCALYKHDLRAILNVADKIAALESNLALCSS